MAYPRPEAVYFPSIGLKGLADHPGIIDLVSVSMTNRADAISARIELSARRSDSLRKDPWTGPHGPSEGVQELRAKARKASVLTPHFE